MKIDDAITPPDTRATDNRRSERLREKRLRTRQYDTRPSEGNKSEIHSCQGECEITSEQDESEIIPYIPEKEKFNPLEHPPPPQLVGKRKETDHSDLEERDARRIKISDLLLLAMDSFSEMGYMAMPAASVEGVPIPKTYSDAITDPIYGEKWKEAIRAEIQTLLQFGTWEVKAWKSAQGNIASTKWVFNVKIGADGRIERFKARLVARGFSQIQGMDFEETFAPVFWLDSLRILFALAAMYGWEAHLLDATNAFVGSRLDIPYYVHIPEGLEEFEGRPLPRQQLVLELKQSLYGL